jgi:hypothetical protein
LRLGALGFFQNDGRSSRGSVLAAAENAKTPSGTAIVSVGFTRAKKNQRVTWRMQRNTERGESLGLQVPQTLSAAANLYCRPCRKVLDH